MIGFSLKEFLQWTRDHLNIAYTDVFGDHLYEDRKASSIAEGKNGLLVKKEKTRAARNLTGGVLRSFLEDFYYRIHIIPRRLDLGNLTSNQTREVYVWNAFLERERLENIDQLQSEGILVRAPYPTPTYFGPLEARTYIANITLDGPPVIDAAFIFYFSSGSSSLRITGRRVVVWPFLPQIEHRETLEWRTDLLPSFSHEQRLALRQAPRQAFSYTFLLDQHSFSVAKALSSQWAHRVYGVPVWSEMTRVGWLPVGTTILRLDTRFADYRNNDLVLIWESSTRFVAVENLQVLEDQIELKLPLEVSFQNAYVAPLRLARTPQGVSFRRYAHDTTSASAIFQVVQNKDLSAASRYPKYRGKDVLTDRTILVGELTERIFRPVDEFDNGSGPVIVDIKENWVNSAKTISFDPLTREERWSVRSWLHSLRGRQRSFWLPSWNQDLILLEDAGASETFITVRPIGYPMYYGIKDIMIQLKIGDQVFARIISGEVASNGNEVLRLSAPLEVGFTVEEVDFICFMSHVRLNSDRVEVQHSYAGRATLSIPVVETPE